VNINTVIKFARRRHRLWEGKPTKDPILSQRKFTNVFRVLDRGSQYLLDLMDLYDDPLDRVALSYFYRQVNRPDTMQDIIQANDGYAPCFAEITDPMWYDEVVAGVVDRRPGAFLSGAYIILIKPGDSRGTLAKMREMFPAAGPYLATVAEEADLVTRVALLRKTPGLGPFMAMQIATDLGYCRGEPDQENTFILAGPGSRRGVGFISDRKPEDVIKTFPVDELPALPGSNGRPASWMDVQNVFCEFSKWVRLFRQGYTGGGKPYERHGAFDWRIPEQFVK
jgi:hypothetical protein